MQAGQINQWVHIEKQGTPADSFSERNWSVVVASCWASVQPVRSSEPRLADAQQSVLTHTVMVRWLPALAVAIESGAWRVRYDDIRSGGTRLLAIQGPGRDVKHAGQWIIFDCVEGLADGH
jgi:head-tail adaptor